MQPSTSLGLGDFLGGFQGETGPPTVTCFHSDTKMITHEFYQKQVSELAESVRTKLANDLQNFLRQHQLADEEASANPTPKELQLKEIAGVVAPPYPEHFASGTIINGFTPTDKNQIETLVKAAKDFNVSVILVMDSE